MSFKNRLNKKIRYLFVLFFGLAFAINSCYTDYGLTTSDYDVVLTRYNKETDFASFRTYALPDTIFHIVGDEEDGIKLVEADFVNERCMLRKGSEQFSMKLGVSPDDMITEEASEVKAKSIIPKSSSHKPPENTSYAERRRKRLMAMRRKATESRKLTEQQAEAALRERQMGRLFRGDTPVKVDLFPPALPCSPFLETGPLTLVGIISSA